MRAAFGLSILKPELCGEFGGKSTEASESNFEKKIISTGMEGESLRCSLRNEPTNEFELILPPLSINLLKLYL